MSLCVRNIQIQNDVISFTLKDKNVSCESFIKRGGCWLHIKTEQSFIVLRLTKKIYDNMFLQGERVATKILSASYLDGYSISTLIHCIRENTNKDNGTYFITNKMAIKPMRPLGIFDIRLINGYS